MNHLISIITTTYNHELYLDKCIESVLNQSYKNWEMIIIDDFSTDKTYEIAHKYIKIDKRIKLIRHSTRWGLKRLKQTYNQALAKSKGELIAILEGDDYWPENKLIKQIEMFKNPDVILSFGDCILVDKNNNPLGIQTHGQGKKYLNNSPIGSILYLFFDLDFYISPVTVMIKKIALQKIKGFKNDKLYPFIDLPTLLNLSLYGSFNYEKTILGYYRKHENSSWFNYAKNTNSMGRTEFIKLLTGFIKKNKKKLKKRNINTHDEKLLQNQNRMLDEKKKEVSLSLAKHYLAFFNFSQAKIISKEAMNQKNQSIPSKIFLLLVISGIINNKFLIKIAGYSRISIYKLIHL